MALFLISFSVQVNISMPPLESKAATTQVAEPLEQVVKLEKQKEEKAVEQQEKKTIWECRNCLVPTNLASDELLKQHMLSQHLHQVLFLPHETRAVIWSLFQIDVSLL